MADYTISVTFGVVALGGAMTAAALRNSLQTLTGLDRLSATAIKDLPNAASVLTVPQIITGIAAVTVENDKLNFVALKNRTKANVTGTQKALNEIGEGNVWSAAFQAGFPAILSGDYFIAKDINTAYNGTLIETGDWVIATTAAPGFNFSTTAWRILKFSKIPATLSAFDRYNDTEAGSGTQPSESTLYKSYALALYSHVYGKDCVAFQESSSSRGIGACASRIGAEAFSSTKFAHSGDAQVQRLTRTLQTTNTTPTEITLPGHYYIFGGKTYDLKVRLVARENLGAKSRSWEWKALVSYTTSPAGNTSIGIPIILSVGSSTLSATLTFTDTYPQRMVITCTGLPATVRWVAYIESLEVYSDDLLGSHTTITEDGQTSTYVY